MAAFERFRSLCGGAKSDANVKVGVNKSKKLFSKKLQKKNTVRLKKANKKIQQFSIENIRLENEKKVAMPQKIVADSFDDLLNQAVKISNDNKVIAESKSINSGREHSQRVNKLNKYGISGWMFDR